MSAAGLPPSADVVVVGAGPTGLTTACVLRSRGLDVLVVDAAERGATASRAAVVHARTLEVLEDLDVASRLVATGVRVRRVAVHDRAQVLARVDLSGLPTAYPHLLLLEQWRTERVLTERLRELGGSVRRPWEVTAVRVDDGAPGAVVTATGPGGTAHEVAARFVVGADGMRSLVRRQAGIDFPGSRYRQVFLSADVRMDWPLPAGEAQAFLSRQGAAVVAPLPEGFHRVAGSAADGADRPDVQEVQEFLDAVGPGGARVREVTWASRFTVRHHLAETFCRGPVLLAGDAAHVHSPVGGQGMNTGIQDGVDLGRTLAAVVTGEAPDAALEDCTRRRRQAARRVIAFTDRGTRLAVTPPALRPARNAAVVVAGRVPAVRRRLARRLAELDAR